MAEFALGLTKTAVEGTVSRVKLAIDEEEKLKVRVRNDLVFITGEFQMMQSFLNVANKERAKNEVVRTWVRQIRDLAFDVEDCVELVVSLDIKSGWSWLWRVVPSCMAPLRPLDQAVMEIQRLKARVEDVSHRNTRYNLIGDSGSSSNSAKPATLVVTTTVSSLPHELMLPASTDAGTSSSPFHIIHEVWETTRKMRPDMYDLKMVINNDGSDLEVISLWGSSGSIVDIAATSIVRKAYNDPLICQEFIIRAWVKLMHPFNLDEFLKSLLTQLYTTSPHQQANLEPCFRTIEDYHLIKAELMQQLCEQRYLVIVEQLCTMVEWDTIRMYLPNSKNGSRIVVMVQQLGIALSCTREPYQVSELMKFSDGQPLIAFFNKVSGRRSDMAELSWHLRCGGVTSVCGCNRGESTVVDKVYTGITHKSKDFDGVEFDRHSWVDVPDPFDLGVFSRRLFFNLHSNDLRATKIAPAGGMMDDMGIIQGCCKFLREDNCLVIINGVNSRDEWDLIKASFLSKPTKGCILIIAMELDVARYCVDEADRVLNIEDLNADAVLRQSIRACEYYGILGKEASSRGRFFSNRREEVCDWIKKFGQVVEPVMSTYRRNLNYGYSQYPGVISMCGIPGKSVIARKFYYDQMVIVREDGVQNPSEKHYEEILDYEFTRFSWVEVPHPFDLLDFCWRLLLDFYSDDIKAKEIAVLGFIQGQDPIQECRKFMGQEKCFIVINGLRSMNDWESIKYALLSSQPSTSCILVITDERNVARQCVQQQEYQALLIEDGGYWNPERNRDFYSRLEEAKDSVNKLELTGRRSERSHIFSRISWNRLQVITVWGIAGVGKSALVKSIYYECIVADLVYNFPRKYSWVNVRQPFSLKDLSRCLLMDFHSDNLEEKETAAIAMMEGQDTIQWCSDFLHQDKRFFIVIDGLCSTDDWDLIKASFLADPIKGSILVITNEESIATHCADKKDNVINIKGLEPQAALDLFTKMAWGSKRLNADKVEHSKLTTTKCGGLPKVITSIGDYCRPAIGKEWLLKKLNDDFMGMLETNPHFHGLRSLFCWMQSYFDDCPDLLKPCIFYMSVFPSGQNIRRRRLLRRWIAEGYCRDTHGNTAEENGERFFSQLVKLSIIQEQQQRQEEMEGELRRNAHVCQVNGFFREYIISRPMQDNLVFALEGRCILNAQRAGQHLTISSSWDRNKIVLESMELSRLRSFTVFGKWMSFFMSANVNMRSLRVLDLEDTSDVTDANLEPIGKLLPRLKFLSLRGCKDITRLPSSMGAMRQLQTLDIKATSIVTLPPTIVKLQKLQYVRAGTTLCISTSSEDGNGVVTGMTTGPPAHSDGVTTLTSTSSSDDDYMVKSMTTEPPTDDNRVSPSQPPPPMQGDGGRPSQQPTANDADQTSTPWSSRPRGGLVLSWLSKLHAEGLVSSARDGVQFSIAAAGGIWKLTALHTLGVINVGGASGKAVLRELKKLTQLRKLKLSGINWKNWQDFCCTISSHGYLESLSVRLDDGEHKDPLCCLDDISKPPKTLKTLKLYGGNVHVSPVWMKQLDGLTKVALEDLELTISTQEDIDSLMELRCQNMYHHISVKPIKDGELRYGRWKRVWHGNGFSAATVLKIDCSSYRSQIVFGPWIPEYVKVLEVHCSTTDASLKLSGLFGRLYELKEVLLKGSYSEAVKQHLEQIVAENWRATVVLKLEDTQHSTPPNLLRA